MSATVYDYTPTQAEAVRAYELLRIACLSRKYHGVKLLSAKGKQRKLYIGKTSKRP